MGTIAALGCRRVGTGNVITLGTLANQPIALAGGADGALHMWNATTSTPNGALRGHAGPVHAVAAMRHGASLVAVSGGEDRTVRAWDVVERRALGAPMLGGHSPMIAVGVGEVEGELVTVAGDQDGTVWAWRVGLRDPVFASSAAHLGWVTSVALGRVGGDPVVISGGEDGTVAVRAMVDGTQLRPCLSGHAGWVNAVAFAESRGRPTVVSVGEDGVLHRWDISVLAPVDEPLLAHRGWIGAVTLGQLRGRQIALTGGEDAALRVWDLASGRLCCELARDDAGQIYSIGLAASDDCVTVAFGDSTGSLWAFEFADRPAGVDRPAGGRLDKRSTERPRRARRASRRGSSVRVA